MADFAAWYIAYCASKNRNTFTDWLMANMEDAFNAGVANAPMATVDNTELVQQLQAVQPVIVAAKTFAKDDSYENLQALVTAIEALQ